jgi:hypothetical protein
MQFRDDLHVEEANQPSQHVFVCAWLRQPQLAPVTCCVNAHNTVDLLSYLDGSIRLQVVPPATSTRSRSDLGHDDLLNYTCKLSIIFN